ncbi:MAG: hypothetical protein FWG30_06595 [Eubacteriaceae bacterium]|nr:hypothetical protein [Eubacteriaceae bacterium]
MKRIAIVAMAVLLAASLATCKDEISSEGFVGELKGSLSLGMTVKKADEIVNGLGEITKISGYSLYYSPHTALGIDGTRYLVFSRKGSLVAICFSYVPGRILADNTFDALTAHYNERLPIIEETLGRPSYKSSNGLFHMWDIEREKGNNELFIYKYALTQSKINSANLIVCVFDSEAFEAIGDSIGAGIPAESN